MGSSSSMVNNCANQKFVEGYNDDDQYDCSCDEPYVASQDISLRTPTNYNYADDWNNLSTIKGVNSIAAMKKVEEERAAKKANVQNEKVERFSRGFAYKGSDTYNFKSNIVL